MSVQYLFKLKGEEHATLQKPPNHKLFDIASIWSPILQRRLDSQNKPSPPPPAAPVFNLTIGNNIVDMFRPMCTQSPCPAAVPALAPAANLSYDLQCPTLLPPSRLPGKDMSLTEFCAMFDLVETILEKLHENMYKTARVLRFITIAELKEMGFKFGEIAALRDAVDSWAVSP